MIAGFDKKRQSKVPRREPAEGYCFGFLISPMTGMILLVLRW